MSSFRKFETEAWCFYYHNNKCEIWIPAKKNPRQPRALFHWNDKYGKSSREVCGRLVPKTIGTAFGWDDWYLEIFRFGGTNCPTLKSVPIVPATGGTIGTALPIHASRLYMYMGVHLHCTLLIRHWSYSNLVHLNKQQFKNAISKNSFVTYILSKIKGLRSQIIYKIDL